MLNLSKRQDEDINLVHAVLKGLFSKNTQRHQGVSNNGGRTQRSFICW